MYTTYETVKIYKGYPDDTKQGIVTAIIPRAMKAIDMIAGRTFEAAADETRYFCVGSDTVGRDLYFFDDLCQITSVKTNADNGTGGIEITANQYITFPRRGIPYYGMRLLNTVSHSWEYTTDPEKGIEIVGRFAYSISAPGDIQQACIRLTLYMLELKDSQVFDVTALPETGQMIIPKGIPADVKMLVDPYRRII